jgi:hypothetical protein
LHEEKRYTGIKREKIYWHKEKRYTGIKRKAILA